MRVLVWLGLLALALLFRLACLRADFWLDEILSFNLSRQVDSPLSVFALRNDNNHPLNTLWLSLWQADAPLWCLRLHSLVAGVVAVFLMGLAGRRLKAETPALILGTACWWLVLASADARGYSLAVAFALAAFLALDSYLARPRWSVLIGFWAAAVLAFLSHLTFLYAYLGLIAMTAPGGTSREQVRRLAVVHAVPGLFFLALYFGFIRGMVVEGGPPADVVRTLTSLLSRGLGGPPGGWLAAPFVLVGLVLFVGGLWSLRAEGDRVWPFFLVTCCLAPVIFLIKPPPFVFERYFLISFTFFLLVIARSLASLLSDTPRVGPVARLAGVFLLFVFLRGNIRTMREYLETGRGQLPAVINQVRAEGGRVTGDHDFRVGTSLRFHAPNIEYVGEKQLPAGGVEWLIVHRVDGDPRPAPADEETDSAGNVYLFASMYPSAGPADWGWYLYRNKDRPVR
jgi:hypothetical protein